MSSDTLQIDLATISISIPELSEVNALLNLNHFWDKKRLNGDFKNGYLPFSFNEETFLKAISSENIVVARHDGKVVGYYFIHNSYPSALVDESIELLKSYFSDRAVNIDEIGLGVQAAIAKEYQGLGLRTSMLDALKEIAKRRYKILFSRITTDNPKAFNGHTHDGWQIIFSNDKDYFVILELH